MERGAKELPASGDDTMSPELITVSDEGVASSAGASVPYHGCIFCKRGFQTPQALGGHMSLHGEQRMRVRAAEQLRMWDALHPYSRERRHGSSGNYLVCFSGNSPVFENPRRPTERGTAEEKRKGDAGRKDWPPEENLDLELRLGNAWYRSAGHES